jgi:H+/Cl- antiporter ClcA
MPHPGIQIKLHFAIFFKNPLKGIPMTPWYVYPLAYLVGILFNLNPSCGSGTMIWTSPLTPMRPILSWFSLKKALLLMISPASKLSAPLVRPSFANRYLMNAILGEAWAVAVVME